ncbi:SRPBCC family protein [Cumulibacter manganitolerans]|uniref:SRPBCC family protein n=1 Tax=Cumulibacter manganitolerans TaxID=1884992 RepID=UPI0012979062|nr:SRPBCC family protein [Cumulibacter manganitolerans]
MITNTHTRRLPVQAPLARRVLDALGTAEDPVWPADRWPALRLDRGPVVGSAGGHGRIGYVVESACERQIVFRFTDPKGMQGEHRFVVHPDGLACVVRHTLEARTSRRLRIAWVLVVRPLHNALIEELLDNLERAVGGRVHRPARGSAYARLLRLLLPPSGRRQPRPRDLVEHDVEVVVIGG